MEKIEFCFELKNGQEAFVCYGKNYLYRFK